MKKSGLSDESSTTLTESSIANSSTIRAVSMNCSKVNRLIGGWSNTTRAIPSAIETFTPAPMTPPVAGCRRARYFNRLFTTLRVSLTSSGVAPNSTAAKSVTPMSASDAMRSATSASLPMMAMSAGPAAPSLSSIAR